VSVSAAAPAVVFVCARNSVRSPMAEALWRRRFGPGVQAVSCGVTPAAWADGFMIAVMAELGEDMSRFECRDIEATAHDPAGLVVCLAEEADAAAGAYAMRRGAPYELWPVIDPAAAGGSRESRLEAYRSVREEIEARIARR